MMSSTLLMFSSFLRKPKALCSCTWRAITVIMVRLLCSISIWEEVSISAQPAYSSWAGCYIADDLCLWPEGHTCSNLGWFFPRVLVSLVASVLLYNSNLSPFKICYSGYLALFSYRDQFFKSWHIFIRLLMSYLTT